MQPFSIWWTTINHCHDLIFIKVRYIFFSTHNPVRVGYDVSMLNYSYLRSPQAYFHVKSWLQKQKKRKEKESFVNGLVLENESNVYSFLRFSVAQMSAIANRISTNPPSLAKNQLVET